MDNVEKEGDVKHEWHKRVAAVILLIGLLIFGLSGCGQSPEPAPKVPQWWDNYVATTDREMEKLTAEIWRLRAQVPDSFPAWHVTSDTTSIQIWTSNFTMIWSDSTDAKWSEVWHFSMWAQQQVRRDSLRAEGWLPADEAIDVLLGSIEKLVQPECMTAQDTLNPLWEPFMWSDGYGGHEVCVVRRCDAYEEVDLYRCRALDTAQEPPPTVDQER